jgi:hypothetical protein
MNNCSKRLICLALFLSITPHANAGIFNMARFVDNGTNAFGIEPEAVVSNGGGLAANLRYSQGISELNDVFALVGTGTNVRTFRIGGGFTFDFIPDMETQPGFGVGFQGIYYRYKGDYGQLETAVVPYLHKSFSDGGTRVLEPFVAVPVGPAFRSGRYDWTAQVVLGAIVHEVNSPIRFIGEVGINANKTESYFSGGLLYQP